MDFSNHTTKTLVDMYNESARAVGEPEVARFSDRATAEKRTSSMYERAKAHRQTSATETAKAQVAAAKAPEQDPGVAENEALFTAKVEADNNAMHEADVKAKLEAHEQDQSKPDIEKAPLETKDNTPTPAVAPALPLASDNPAKDKEMPALRKVVRLVNTQPKTRIFPRKEGTKQAALVDLLGREQGATFGELYDGLKLVDGKPWTGVSIRSGLAWDVNNICGYGVTSEAFNGEEFAKQGRAYEAHHLGFGTPAYNPAFKLLVYRLSYPKGMTEPVAHIGRPVKPTAEQKAAAAAAVKALLDEGKKTEPKG